MNAKKNNKIRKISAFTLVELIMVIVIIGLLAAIVVPRFSSSSDEARISATKANLESLRSAVDLYRVQAGSPPPTLTTLTVTGTVLTEPLIRIVPDETITNSNAVVGASSNTGGWVYNTVSGNVNVNLTDCRAMCGDNPYLDW